MANFARVKADWTLGNPEANDFEELDVNITKTANFADGSTHSPSAPVIVGGSGFQLTTPLDADDISAENIECEFVIADTFLEAGTYVYAATNVQADAGYCVAGTYMYAGTTVEAETDLVAGRDALVERHVVAGGDVLADGDVAAGGDVVAVDDVAAGKDISYERYILHAMQPLGSPAASPTKHLITASRVIIDALGADTYILRLPDIVYDGLEIEVIVATPSTDSILRIENFANDTNVIQSKIGSTPHQSQRLIYSTDSDSWRKILGSMVWTHSSGYDSTP